MAFSGSNSSTSINQQLAIYAGSLVNPNVATVEVADIRDYELPIYSLDLEKSDGLPQAILDFKAKVDAVDAFIFSSPEYNGLVPAAFKNLFDWFSRVDKVRFGNKPMLLMSTSPGANGGKSNREILEKIFPYAGAEIVATYSLGNFFEKMVDGALIEEDKGKLQAAVIKLEASLK